jgi:hypothetical protein
MEMVNRNDPNVAIDKLTESDIAAARGYLRRPLFSRNLNSDNLSFDDVIASLANAHENQRARITSEWERLGLKQFRVSGF